MHKVCFKCGSLWGTNFNNCNGCKKFKQPIKTTYSNLQVKKQELVKESATSIETERLTEFQNKLQELCLFDLNAGSGRILACTRCISYDISWENRDELIKNEVVRRNNIKYAETLDILLGEAKDVFKFVYKSGLVDFEYNRKQLYGSVTYNHNNKMYFVPFYMKGIDMEHLIKVTTKQDLIDYSNTCNSIEFLTSADKQLFVMAKYWSSIIDKCTTILSARGPLLYNLIVAHGCEIVGPKTRRQLSLVCKLSDNYTFQMPRVEYVNDTIICCKNKCGSKITIQAHSIIDTLPTCCRCKTPDRACVECSNLPIIITCSVCKLHFHKDPDYRGNVQKCEKCRI